ncbi:MAG: hypothetical protein V1771_05665 [Chloroflexota bacterium]
MARCPNCGQETKRTDDWACQWCGYPLLSGGYKKIDKSFREVKGEPVVRPEPEQEEIEETPPAPRKVARAPEPEPEPGPEPEPAAEPPPPPPPRPVPPPPPAPRPAPVPAPALVIPLPPPAPVPPPAPAPAPVAPPPPPEPVPPPSPPPPVVEPLTPPRPNPIMSVEVCPDVVDVTTEEVTLAFQADKPAASSKLANRMVRVTGIIDKVFVKEHLDIQYIILTTPAKLDIFNVRATFDKKLAYQLRRLTPGEKVTAQGKYNGAEKNVILKDCVLVK